MWLFLLSFLSDKLPDEELNVSCFDFDCFFSFFSSDLSCDNEMDFLAFLFFESCFTKDFRLDEGEDNDLTLLVGEWGTVRDLRGVRLGDLGGFSNFLGDLGDLGDLVGESGVLGDFVGESGASSFRLR